MRYFAFQPSDNLRHEIEQIIQHQHNPETELYHLRDNLTFRMNDEIIDALLIGLIRVLPESEKRNIAEKLANTVKTTVYTLLNQLLVKADNQAVQASIQFMQQSYLHIEQKSLFGTALDETLVEQLLQHYEQIEHNISIDKNALSQSYKQFADAIIQRFMIDFNHTLNLGLIKRKASDLAASATIKAIHMAIDKIIPQLQDAELKIMANYHRQFFI